MKGTGIVILETLTLIFVSLFLCSKCEHYTGGFTVYNNEMHQISTSPTPYSPQYGYTETNGIYAPQNFRKHQMQTHNADTFRNIGNMDEFLGTYLEETVPVYNVRTSQAYAEKNLDSAYQRESTSRRQLFDSKNPPSTKSDPYQDSEIVSTDSSHRASDPVVKPSSELPYYPRTTPVSFPSPEQEYFARKSPIPEESKMLVTTTEMTSLTSATSAPITSAKPRIAKDERTVTIVVTGRSGSGVSSTIRELVGHKTKCIKPAEQESLTDIMEYTISDIPSESGNAYKLKLIDLPGFVDGRTMEQDAQILSTLKSYISLAGPPGPSFFLVLSRFDDNRIFGIHSLFVQLVNRVELFKSMFLDKILPSNRIPFIFLLTRFMSDTKLNQRRPADKIATFRQAVSDYSQSNFSSFVSFVVGENKANTEHNAKIANGYYKLPNREYYPKNVWQALLNNTNQFDEGLLELLSSLMENREVEMSCEAKIIKTRWEHFDEDADAFEYLLKLDNKTIEDTGVNHDIDFFYERKGKPRSKYIEEIIQKTALQLYLQNENILEKPDFPKDYEGKAGFFQKSTLVSGTIPALILDESFKLKMPEYIDELTVGYGYAVLADEKTLATPFEATFIPSPVGYQLPNFMKCRKFPRQESEDYMVYSHNISEYFSKRLEWLDFPQKENVSLNDFAGKVKEGYNIPPESGSSIASLTGVKETRILKCTLSASRFWKLKEDFLATMDELTQFDATDRESVAEWKHFFNKFGSHIISKSFGGGRLHGSIVGPKVLDVLDTQQNVDATLHSVMKFAPFADQEIGVPKYRFYGGVLPNDSDTEKLYEMTETDRDVLLKNWRDSLSSNFVMLKNELVLEPISSIVKEKVGPEEGEWVEEATALYLRGELKYNNKRGRGGNRKTGTKKPKLTRLSPSPQENTKGSTRHPSHQSVSPSTAGLPDSVNSPLGSIQSEIDNNYEDFDGIGLAMKESFDANINVINQTLRLRGTQDERRHQQHLTEFERRRKERQRISMNQLEEMTKESEKKKKDMDARYASRLDQIKKQGEQDEEHYDSLMEELRRQNEKEEQRHQLLLKMLEKRRKEEEEILRQKERNQCSWLTCAWEFAVDTLSILTPFKKETNSDLSSRNKKEGKKETKVRNDSSSDPFEI